MTATITPKLVSELRTATGAGMSDCKKALEEVGGSIDDAIKLLRERGVLKAAKRADRSASEGLVGFAVAADKSAAALVELNCETDFVARNESFPRLATQFAEAALRSGATTVDELLDVKLDSGLTVRDELNGLLSRMGEKIEISRVTYAKGDVVAVYIHPPGKIGVLVTGNAGGADAAKRDMAAAMLRDIGMHIAAFAPRFLDHTSVDEKTLASEREIAANIARNEGKPEAMITRIVDGRMKKFYEEACLLLQAFARDENVTVGKFVVDESKKAGFTLGVTGFTRMQVGADRKAEG